MRVCTCVSGLSRHRCSSFKLTTNGCLRDYQLTVMIDGSIDGILHVHGQGMHLYTILCMVI